ncbi:hypothetical protein P691DRAFT_401026 [Macrolepiota fuliginosa MF-IS2]|uniref:Sec23/Sec24 beta-sandwich domain-containing protein n=1 Tax=Macrolepiota fuliginosa MF-IS2 TaxID=1400762 RepID=A0A9P6BX48_9AGAR|nr:hypothetical protein P691DRAFT_401026 [Macrolepiota fuliginosa MF-IS2]
MRFYCSSDPRIMKLYGSFVQSSPTDLDFSILDADKTIWADFEHPTSFNPHEYAYIHRATLYATVWGEQRYADMDAVFCRFACEGEVGGLGLKKALD